MATVKLTREDFIGMNLMAKARRGLVVNMFAGTQLKFSKSSVASTGGKLVMDAKKLHKLGSTLAQGGKAATKSSIPGLTDALKAFVTNCTGIDNMDEVVAAIGGEAAAELAAEITPVLGILVSSGKLAQATKAVVEDGRNLYKFESYKSGFRPGDPQAAADAIKTIIERNLARHSVDLARQSLATGTKIAGLFADLGTVTNAAIGMASTLASVGLKLFALGLDIKDLRAGNARLAQPATMDLTIFGECPILGCYLLTCSDTSQVSNMFIADIGLPGWMDSLEAMKKKQMAPLLKIATQAIQASPLQLEGLSSNKGTHAEQGFYARTKAKMVKMILG